MYGVLFEGLKGYIYNVRRNAEATGCRKNNPRVVL